MYTELPSLSAFALEGSGAAAMALGDAHTLTLRRPPRGERLEDPMAASIRLRPARDTKPSPLRAVVAPTDFQGLTLTL